MSPEPTMKEEVSHYDNVAQDGHSTIVRPARVFTAEEEAKLYRKIDIRILPILSVRLMS